MEAFTKTCRDNNIISAFIRLNPLIDFPAGEITVPVARTIHGRTVGVDLTLSKEEIRGQGRKSHRADLSRLCRQDFTTSMDDWSRYHEFTEIYEETMDRRNADSYYHFGAGYFERLKEALGDKLHLSAVISPDGKLAAGALLMEMNGIVQGHLNGTAAEYRALAPAKLAIDAVIWWAKERGNRIFHLGGGVGGKEDDLFRFKQGFSERTFRFETWRIITDNVKYAQVARAGTCVASDRPSFFPSYRSEA
jgi:lipid II:glycine glycyltransferase (peptidoglycan interpeptide bridge formation enzyme)